MRNIPVPHGGRAGVGLLLGPRKPRGDPVDTKGPLTIQSQGSFFIGGTVRHVEGLSGSDQGPDVVRAGEIHDRADVCAVSGTCSPWHLPVVMVHGGGLSGQAYDTTPDGRMGWSEYFLRAGRPVYVVDQAGRARSGFDATPYNAVRLGTAKEQAPVQVIGHEYAWTWFRLGPKFGVPYPDTQFPVDAVDAFYKMWIPDLNAGYRTRTRASPIWRRWRASWMAPSSWAIRSPSCFPNAPPSSIRCP